MGVLSCDRTGCTNIMCDRYSHTYGYICNDCFKELLRLGINSDIRDFMNSTKSDTLMNDEEAAQNRLNNEFLND